MGLQQSKDELLYQQVSYGNSEGIKALRREGAGLEWMDKEGKTPLILACMNPGLYDVAKTLIELGANVNAYRPGRHAGTPLHHAAKRGLEQTVKLLLSHGANALVMNDDCQTPLDVARIKGFSNVVRGIESHICLFSGWLRELYGPSFLELFAPQLLCRKVWVVVIPCGSRNLRKPFKLELAVYANLQDAQPRTVIALWKANMADPNFSQLDPTVIITDSGSIPKRWRRRRGLSTSQVAGRTRIKLAAAKEGDKQQLQWFCNACKGIPQVVQPAFSLDPAPHGIPATAPPSSEDMEIAMAINASLQSTSPSNPSTSRTNNDVSSEQAFLSKGSGNGGKCPESSPVELVAPQGQAQAGPTTENPIAAPIPSAPPLEVSPVDDGPIQYPSIDNSFDFTSHPMDKNSKQAGGNDTGVSSSTSSCVICLDAPVEGACIPCGHMAGCMSCLSEIKAKSWGCPVCRANIDQVVRLYAV